MIAKTCTKCLIAKSIDEFHKHPTGKHGRQPVCKQCTKLNRAKSYEENKEEKKIWQAGWRERNPEYYREYYAENRDRLKELKSSRYQENPSYISDWRKRNPDKVKANNARSSARRRSTPKGRLEDAIASGVNRGLRSGSKGGRRTFDLLGYSVEQLKDHLENLFEIGMSWENYGKKGWEIDHIIPLSAHNYDTPDDIDFRRAWALSNLRPLWQFQNTSKHNQLIQPFQPSLTGV